MVRESREWLLINEESLACGSHGWKRMEEEESSTTERTEEIGELGKQWTASGSWFSRAEGLATKLARNAG